MPSVYTVMIKAAKDCFRRWERLRMSETGWWRVLAVAEVALAVVAGRRGPPVSSWPSSFITHTRTANTSSPRVPLSLQKNKQTAYSRNVLAPASPRDKTYLSTPVPLQNLHLPSHTARQWPHKRNRSLARGSVPLPLSRRHLRPNRTS